MRQSFLGEPKHLSTVMYSVSSGVYNVVYTISCMYFWIENTGFYSAVVACTIDLVE